MRGRLLVNSRSLGSQEGSEGQSVSWTAGPLLRAWPAGQPPGWGSTPGRQHTANLLAHLIPCCPWPWAGEVGTLLWPWSLEQVCDSCVLTWIVNRPSGFHEVSVRKWTISWRFKKKVQLWAGGHFPVGRVLAWPAGSPGFNPQHCTNRARWHTPVIAALRGWRQKNQKSKVFYVVSSRSALVTPR